MLTLEKLKTYDKAKSTQKSYASDWKKFEAWASEVGATPLPCSQETIINYLLYLGEKEYAWSTINRYLVSIKSKHTENGYSNLINDEVLANKEALRRYLAEARNKVGTPEIKHAKPFEREKYETLIKGINSFDIAGARDKALFSLAYATGMRVSEVANLQFSDLQYKQQDGHRVLFITIRNSKTDQYSKGQFVRVTAFTDVKLCPIANLDNWQRFLGRSFGYIFVGFTKTKKPKLKSITRQSVFRLVKCYFGKDYSPHSFRSSHVTHAADRGATIQEIMNSTRHGHINSVMIYLDVRMMNNNGADYLGRE